ncbi:MAG: HutD family protein [Pseudomonadota bacterium]
MTLRLLHVSEAATRPWKNGGGSARDLLLWPGEHEPCLQISVADITRDGAFSPYPGIDRWFVLLQGAGVELTWPHAVRRLHAGHALLHFDGGNAPGCRLMGGPACAFNVLHRRGCGRVAVKSAAPLSTPPEGFDHFALFVREAARLQPEKGMPVDLPPWSLVWGERLGLSLELQAADAHAWWVGFDARQATR